MADAPVIRELLAAETHLAYSAMLELRPTIGTRHEFVEWANTIQRPEGYRLIGSFAHGVEEAVGVAGFRTGHFLAWNHILYCDDLSTLSAHRRLGHAGALLDWMVAEARQLGCTQFHLDSGVIPEARAAAHRLYMSKGMVISAYHFVLTL
jgi:GNAT superfamily N-acetyltransferase